LLAIIASTIRIVENRSRYANPQRKSPRNSLTSNASEVVREGLRLLEQREPEGRAKIDWLRAAAKAGFHDIDGGDYVTLRSGEEIDDFVDQVRREVPEKPAAERVSS
jgi:antitoxin ParD1/3/4